MSLIGLTADDALAVDGDGDCEALHVGHGDTQYLAVIVQAPHSNVFSAARRHQLRTVTDHNQPTTLARSVTPSGSNNQSTVNCR